MTSLLPGRRLRLDPLCAALRMTGLFTLSMAALPVVSTAQESPQTAVNARTIAPEEVERVIVTGRSLESTLPLELSRYGADLEIVSAEEIANHGFVDVAQSLEMLVPGVHLTTRHGAFSYIDLSLQGSRSSDVLFTVDGVRINNRLYNSTGPTDTLPSSMIERMEVLKGGQGLLYGTQAIAGVTNVVTKGFSDAPDGGVTLGTGSHGLVRTNAYYRDSAGDHQYAFWGSYDHTDGYETYDIYAPGVTDRDRGYDVRSGGMKYGYSFSDDLSLTVLGIHTEADLDNTSTSGNPHNSRDEEIFSLRLDYTPDDSAQFFVKSYFHDWDSFWVEGPGPGDYWGYDDFGLSFASRLTPGENLEYHIGYDFQTYEGHDDVLLIADQREDVHAVYGQIRSSEELFENAGFTLGIRRDRTGGVDSTVWSTSGIYHFSDYLYVQGVVGTTFMLPSAENLYRIHCPNPFTRSCTHGNPNLEPEESIGVNVSIGGRVDISNRPMSWQLTTWDRRIDNLITRIDIPADFPNPPPPEFDRIFVNIDDEVKATGYEMLFRGPITDALSFNVSYTYSKERNSDGTVREDRPKRTHKASLAWGPPSSPFGFNIAYKYVGDQFRDITDFGEQNYGDYYVVNLGAHVMLGNEGKHRLGLRLENALDETYSTTLGTLTVAGTDPVERLLWHRLGPPRSVHLNYSVSFR